MRDQTLAGITRQRARQLQHSWPRPASIVIDGGVHDHGVVGGPQRRDRAACIAPVTLGDLQRKGGEVSIESLVFQLVITPPGPLFGARRQEDLERGGRENHRAHVPAVGDQPGGLGKGALALQQRRPDGRHGRHPRGALARLLGPDGAG